jgi:hypothetical protein
VDAYAGKEATHGKVAEASRTGTQTCGALGRTERRTRVHRPHKTDRRFIAQLYAAGVPKPGKPRFNHVALSLAPEALSEDGRRDIISFYSEVFGWEELPTETIDRRRLVLMAHSYDQFVFLHADEKPMSAPSADHFGMGVASVEELEELHERARLFRERDGRVELTDKSCEKHPGVTLTSFYVRYLLPLMVEVQHFAFEPGR